MNTDTIPSASSQICSIEILVKTEANTLRKNIEKTNKKTTATAEEIVQSPIRVQPDKCFAKHKSTFETLCCLRPLNECLNRYTLFEMATCVATEITYRFPEVEPTFSPTQDVCLQSVDEFITLSLEETKLSTTWMVGLKLRSSKDTCPGRG